nr:MAG TPA: hypothetical protein [Caudoviricetes sp.]
MQKSVDKCIYMVYNYISGINGLNTNIFYFVPRWRAESKKCGVVACLYTVYSRFNFRRNDNVLEYR